MNLKNLPPDLAREVLEHEKWKLLEKHRHQKELLLIKLGIAEGSEIYFGSDKSNLIDPETVIRAAWGYAKPLSGPDSPFELVSGLVAASWCGKRLARYPTAKDAKEATKQIREDFNSLTDKYTLKEIDSCITLIPDFDSRIIGQELEDLRNDEKSRIVNSPLFKEFQNCYPYIESENFEVCYRASRQNFVEAGIASLRRSFKTTPPPELSDRASNWAQSSHQYLPAFLKKWQTDLRKIETRMKIAQKAWRESTS